MLAFQAPYGVLPRFRLIACGWMKPGDRLRDPTDWRWWTQKYAKPSLMWAALAASARISESYLREMGDAVPVPIWNAQLASGTPSELAHDVAMTADELAIIERAGQAARPGFLFGANGIPVPRWDVLPPELCKRYPRWCKDPRKAPIPKIPPLLPSVPWWVWAFGVYLLARKKR